MKCKMYIKWAFKNQYSTFILIKLQIHLSFSFLLKINFDTVYSDYGFPFHRSSHILSTFRSTQIHTSSLFRYIQTDIAIIIIIIIWIKRNKQNQKTEKKITRKEHIQALRHTHLHKQKPLEKGALFGERKGTNKSRQEGGGQRRTEWWRAKHMGIYG